MPSLIAKEEPLTTSIASEASSSQSNLLAQPSDALHEALPFSPQNGSQKLAVENDIVGNNKKKKKKKKQQKREGMRVEGSKDNGPPNADLGPFLLMQAKTTIASGEHPHKALDYAIRAVKSFETAANGEPCLELVMALHTLGAIHSTLGQFEESIPVLEYSIRITDVENGGIQHALAAFAGYMQLGDTFTLLGRSQDAIRVYHAGLQVQKLSLGDMDPRVGETCRYIAEAHLQVMQYNEAEELCKHALEIHKMHSNPASVGEATDRRLIGLIYNGKGEYEAALEHLVLASMALITNGLDVEVAAVDCSIGDTYVSLGRFDEAIFAYQKALTVYKSAQGENHASVASVYVSLADLYLKTGKLRESKTYCESALKIYGRRGGGHQLNDVATGLTDIAAIYEALNEHEQALVLLQKALSILEAAPGQQSAAAAVEAQIGVLHFLAEKFKESYAAFRNAVKKMRVGAERNSSHLGITLNQMGLVCVELYKIQEATELFKEAIGILEMSHGLYHPNTLVVQSNLAAAYDALGRLDDAIIVLQYVVEAREEKLGTADPEVDDERRRLAELLKETGRVRAQRANGTLELLLDTKETGHSRNKNLTTEPRKSLEVRDVLQTRVEVAAH